MNTDDVKIIASIPLMVFVGVFLIFFVAGQLAFPGAEAKIEQLRHDVEKVGVGANEDVIGQVTKWNQNIRSYQRYNKVLLISIIIPDAWDDVEPIEIPTR